MPANLQTTEGHLTAEGIALYAEAMHLDRVADLPKPLFAHLTDCPLCTTDVLNAYQLTGKPDVDAENHPYLGEPSRPDNTFANGERLDELLQRIIREALEETAKPNPSLEKSLLQVVKSGGATNFAQPRNNAVFVEKLPHQLNPPSQNPIRLMLQNENGEVVRRAALPPNTGQYELDCSNLPDGLYYWAALVGSHTIARRVYLCSRKTAERFRGQNRP